MASARDLDQDESLRLLHDGVVKPLEQLLQQATQRYPGSGLREATLGEDDGIYSDEIERVTATGQVREIELDAMTTSLPNNRLGH